MSYFNETGPIYQQELVQASEFSKFVHAHVVTGKGPNGNLNPGDDSVRFDWETFQAAVSSLQGPDLSFEHEVCAFVPPYPIDASQDAPVSPSTLWRGADADVSVITVQAVIDALVARFASLFAHALFIPPSDGASGADTGYGADQSPRTRAQCLAYFFDVFRRNLYYAFTRHLGARDGHEHCLSAHRCGDLDVGVTARSAWEYRLLFVHPEARSGTVKGLVVTVTLKGNFEDEVTRTQSSGYDAIDEDECESGSDEKDGDEEDEDEDEDEEEEWYGISLDSRGSFSGTLRAMQVSIGEGFRCP